MRVQPVAFLLLPAAIACSRGDSSSAESAPAKIGACWGRPTIGEGGVGTVRVNRTVAQLARTCVTRDTAVSFAGALPDGAKVVRYGGHELVAVVTTTRGDRRGAIARVIVGDPAFRTAAGVGVGSTVAELRAAYGAVCPLSDEDEVGVRVRGLAGVAFGLRHDAPTPPDTAHVTAVWIYEPGLDAGAPCE